VPILSLDAGNSCVSITPAGTDATDEALKFARALLRATQEFADDVERLHAAQRSDASGSDESTTKADESKAA
jgi:hypothetical protein